MVKNNLRDILVYQTCYERDSNISDDMVLTITSLARDCWLKDEYSKAGMDNYADYILNGVYDYKVSKEQLEDLYPVDIVEAFNQEDEFEELLKFDISDYEYCFTTTDNEKYYLSDDGFYILNEKGMKIKDPHPMDDSQEDIFDLFENNKIKFMPLSMHYNIRCMIKNDIQNNEKLKEKYKKGIENYIDFCKERFIVSRDILNAVNLDTDIDLTEEDKIYTDKNKLKRLEKLYKKNLNNKNEYKNYSYVGSLNNGTDYYFNDGIYLAIDKNNVSKYFDDEPLFLLKEINKKDKFAYISKTEAEKISDELTNDYVTSLKDKKYISYLQSDINLYSIRQFLKYENDKELNSFKDKSIPLSLTLRLSFEDIYKEDLKHQREQTKELKNKQKENIEKDL